MTKPAHTPVLVAEFIAAMRPGQGGRLLDGTLGLGGHTKVWLETFSDSTAVGIELDAHALVQAKENLENVADRMTYVQGSYSATKELIAAGHIKFPPYFTHILLDLGIGSHQLSDGTRGFSFQQRAPSTSSGFISPSTDSTSSLQASSGFNSPLTMRYGAAYPLPPADVKALNVLERRLGISPDVQDILSGLSIDELKDVIWTYGEEKYAGRIAYAIKQAGRAISTSQALAEIITSAVPKAYTAGRIHPATRTFLALRLAVNRELEVLAKALPELVALLSAGGKIAVISFHSLEDRIVKQFMKSESKDCICPPQNPVCVCHHTSSLHLLTKKPITAGEAEIVTNPRSRSAKMRVAQKKPADP